MKMYDLLNVWIWTVRYELWSGNCGVSVKHDMWNMKYELGNLKYELRGVDIIRCETWRMLLGIWSVIGDVWTVK